MRILTLLLLPCLCMGQKGGNYYIRHGTTILLYHYRDTIYLAVDRKASIVDSDKFSLKTKIYQYKNIVYTFSGPSLLTNGKDTLFNPEKVISEALSKNEDINECYNNIHNSLMPKIKEYASIEKFKSPAKFKQYFSGPMFQFIIIKIKNNQPFYRHLSYTLTGNLNYWEVDSVRGGKYDKRINFLPFGSANGIDSFLNVNTHYFNDKRYSVIDKLTCLIYIESIINSKNVSMPVDAVKIFSSGCKWYLNKKECLIY